MRRSFFCPLACSLVLAVLSALGAAAQQQAPAQPQAAAQPPEIDEVVVTATRIDTSILDSPSLVTVITPRQIAQSGTGDLAGVLASQSGVVINDYGPQGQGKQVSIRGSTSAQVLIMVDGIRMNSSFDGYVDLSRIPIADIDHVEVVQGGASSLWGTGAVGGVINIITRKPDKPQVSLDISNGSYLPHDATAVTESGQSLVAASALSLVDSQNVNLFLGGRLGALGLTGGGSFTRAANAFLWNDTADLGGWRQRNNAQDLAESAFVGMDLPMLEGTFTTKGAFTHALVGVPGSTAMTPFVGATSQATQEDTTAMGSFSLTTSRFLADALSLDLKGAFRYAQETYDNPLFPPQSVHTTNAANVDLTQKLTVSDALSTVYGASVSYEQVDSTNLSTTNNRFSLAGFLSVPLTIAESLTITPSARYDYYSDFPGYLSAQLAVVWAVSDASSLRTTLGTSYRVPTLSDLYWTDPYGDTGNPNLKPETSYSGELGWAFQREGVSLQAAAFARMVFNQIEWVYNGLTFTTSVVNVTQSFLPGVEVHGKLSVAPWLSLRADYAFIYSFLLQYPYGYQFSVDQRVPWTPVHNVTVGADYTDSRNTAGLELQYVSEKSYFDSGAAAWKSLPGYVLLNASYALRTSEALSLSVQLKNILNTLYFTEAGGYPMPPFSVVTGVQLHL